MDIIRLLSRSDFFKGISKRSLTSLSAICIPKSIKKRQILFLEGQEGHLMYLLGRGNIQLYKDSRQGKEIVIKVIQPGEIFAEVILFEEKHYPVSAVALKESLVLMLPKHQISCLLADEIFRNDFIGLLMRKQRYLTERIYYLTTHDVEDRFFRFLSDSAAFSSKDR